jgi:osmotically inducible lipoprotein OsmB
MGDIIMKRSGRLRLACITGAAMLALLSGCTLGGAAVGGVAGNKLTHGSTLGTVGGAVAGGVVGYELSK